MSEINSVVAIYDTHSQAEKAVSELQRSGFDMNKTSIVGKDYHHRRARRRVLYYRRSHEVLGQGRSRVG
ncbi:general stress protein [Candidatus Binatus sp.]|jgi:hypothetical protein|uniref:general stress protein n=1 Tax=Candidatus Binatus sp. TaxID=2811406 RepID=UPI003C6EC2C9